MFSSSLAAQPTITPMTTPDDHAQQVLVDHHRAAAVSDVERNEFGQVAYQWRSTGHPADLHEECFPVGLDGGVEPSVRVRAPGGGRKPASEIDPGLVPALQVLVDPDTRGDPESPLMWTTKSTKNLADALASEGH